MRKFLHLLRAPIVLSLLVRCVVLGVRIEYTPVETIPIENLDMKRNLLLIVFASVLCLILASQVREVPPLPPMDVRRIKVPPSYEAIAARDYETDFNRKIDSFGEEWNTWLKMRAKRDKNIVDLKALCKEKEQIEKVAKLLAELQEHKASPCQRCTESQQGH